MSAFQISGKTVTFTAANSVPSAVQCVGHNNERNPQYVVTNTGSVGAFISWGETAAEAAALAVIPTSTSQYGYWMLPASQVTISARPGAFFTGQTASGTAVIYVTPGVGE